MFCGYRSPRGLIACRAGFIHYGCRTEETQDGERAWQQGQLSTQVLSDKGTCGGRAEQGLTVLLSKSSRERGEVSKEMEQGEEMED